MDIKFPPLRKPNTNSPFYTADALTGYAEATYRLNGQYWGGANDPVRFERRVARAREAMGTRYLCHPANRVKRLTPFPITWSQQCLPLRSQNS